MDARIINMVAETVHRESVWELRRAAERHREAIRRMLEKREDGRDEDEKRAGR